MAMAALVAVLAAVTLVTLAVGVLGAARTRKDRPRLRSFDLATAASGDMGSDAARTTPQAKTDTEKTASQRHHRHGAAKRSRWTELLQLLWQLTGIPLLTAREPEADSAMGTTTTPTTTLLVAKRENGHDAKIDIVHANKIATVEREENEHGCIGDQHKDDDKQEEEEEDEDAQQLDEHKLAELRTHIMLDGLQFYSAVATLSVATVGHAVDIALFRASALVLRERRKAEEDASIEAIETLYPDIMCLPPDADVRYAGPRKPSPSAPESRRSQQHPLSPRQLETRFLTAA